MKETIQAALAVIATSMVGSACIADDGTDEADEATTTLASTTGHTASGLVRHTVTPRETGFAECVDNAPDNAIGCDQDNQWGSWANNTPHVLFPGLFTSAIPESQLLVYFPGRNNNANSAQLTSLLETAALQGYHVIALTYPNQGDDSVTPGDTPEPGNITHYCVGSRKSECIGTFMQEIIDGTNCPASICAEAGNEPNINNHKQDSIVRRLEQVLLWANVAHPFEGWNQYLDSSSHVRWSRVTTAGFSLGSGYAAMVGEQFSVRRVAMLAGPNDSTGGLPVEWIQPVSHPSRFFGMIHNRNESSWIRTTDAWFTFGMQGLRSFDPSPNTTPNFGTSQMLISTDQGTLTERAHVSVMAGVYIDCTDDLGHTAPGCHAGDRIGYEPAWRHIVGSGIGN